MASPIIVSLSSRQPQDNLKDISITARWFCFWCVTQVISNAPWRVFKRDRYTVVGKCMCSHSHLRATSFFTGSDDFLCDSFVKKQNKKKPSARALSLIHAGHAGGSSQSNIMSAQRETTSAVDLLKTPEQVSNTVAGHKRVTKSMFIQWMEA